MPAVTPPPARLVLLVLGALALTGLVLAPALVIQVAVRGALLLGGAAVVLALRPRARAS